MCIPFNLVISLPGNCPTELFIHGQEGAWKGSSGLHCLTVNTWEKPDCPFLVHICFSSIHLVTPGNYWELSLIFPSSFSILSLVLCQFHLQNMSQIYPFSLLYCHCLSPSRCQLWLVLHPNNWPPNFLYCSFLHSPNHSLQNSQI